MAIFQTLIHLRRQSLRHTTPMINSIRFHSVSSLSEPNFDVELSREESVKARNLPGLFSGENINNDVEIEVGSSGDIGDGVMLKKLSTEMVMFVEELYKGGYFYNVNFLPGNAFDISHFDDYYSRGYIRFAADRFANDHQEIAKWLSGSQVKTVALYGCPTLVKKTIFAAKRLRAFFRIQEDMVCSRCVLRDSCQFVNKHALNGDSKKLKLDDTLRVIILYALEATHPKLPLPDHFKATINLLLRDIINLSKTTS